MIGPELTDQASYTVRQLIGLWGFQGRTPEAIEVINADLARRRIAVQPDFTTVQLDDVVQVREQPAAPEPALTGDLSWRVGNVVRPQHVACVRLHDPLAKAFGLMVAHEYSQLPSWTRTAACTASSPGRASPARRPSGSPGPSPTRRGPR